MIKFLMSLFRRKDKEETLEPANVESGRDFDFIDYDGMGNQGRFPVDKNNKRRRR